MYYVRMASSTDSATRHWDAAVWGLLAVLCGVLFLDGLDVSMVGVALPSIESDLGLTTSQLQWVVSGFVLGGALTELGWRWTFVLPVPIALVLLVLAPRFLPKDDPAPVLEGKRAFDVPGAVTLSAGMLLLVRTLVEAPAHGWTSASTL